ncbi:MAG: DUF4377 domain-containing protein [Moraxella sp.]|uniref:DUF4377 domain-containing protein n=1 Tax=Moraxella sp. TaxID=479 RepID=UPI0026DCF009|nr:DUF4377 domain-containing protein [Moraxella sp.]MDO4450379.1 DUF4377 domain-containing protein [Moraxella sp.]
MKILRILPVVLAMGLVACQSTPPKPQPRYIPDVALQPSEILEVLPYRGACNSASPMQCLLVKKAGGADDEIFGIGYNDILGFEAKVGVSYQIKVRQQIDRNTNTPTGFWQLEEILVQQK